MPIHLTPTELARESGLERREVLSKCLELGIPVFHGCIDRTLFEAGMRGSSPAPGAPTDGPSPRRQAQPPAVGSASGMQTAA